MNHEDVGEPTVPTCYWEALRRDPLESEAIERAYLRFVTPRELRLGARLLAGWLVAGFVLGCGVVFAATARPFFSGWRSFFSTGVETRPLERAIPGPRTRVAARPSSKPPASATATASTPVEPAAPAGVESALVPTPELPLRVPASQHSAVSAPSVPDERARRDPNWRRVLSALKAGDHAEAESALRGLEASGSASDAEAAALSLAEVLLARGKVSEARARLERLSTSAASPLVRAKARALLAEKFEADDRSPTPGPATH